MSLQYPYLAVIYGQEHVLEGWRDETLITDKGEYIFHRLQQNYSLNSVRLLEVASLQLNNKGEWLINGHALSPLQTLYPALSRIQSITRGEVLRVHKGKIHAVAWVQTGVNNDQIISQLDSVLAFWKIVLQPIRSVEGKPVGFAEVVQKIGEDFYHYQLFREWSTPVWLTEFQMINSDAAKTVRLPLKNVAAQIAKSVENRIEAHQQKSIARFEKDYTDAVIPQKGGKELNVSIEMELQTLIKEIVDAGGRLSRQNAIKQFTSKHGKGNSENYQPEKLFRSKTAKVLIEAGLIGTDKLARTSTFWVK